MDDVVHYKTLATRLANSLLMILILMRVDAIDAEEMAKGAMRLFKARMERALKISWTQISLA